LLFGQDGAIISVRIRIAAVTDNADKRAAETQTLLKILELGKQDIKDGKTWSLTEVLRRRRVKLR